MSALVMIVPTNFEIYSGSWRQKLEPTLLAMKTAVSKKLKSLNLASAVTLCAVDSSLNIISKEDDHAGGGWSQVSFQYFQLL